MSPFRGAEVSKIDVLLDASHDGGLHVCGPIGDPSHMHFAESVGSQVILLAPLEARATNTVYSIADPDALGSSEDSGGDDAILLGDAVWEMCGWQKSALYSSWYLYPRHQWYRPLGASRRAWHGRADAHVTFALMPAVTWAAPRVAPFSPHSLWLGVDRRARLPATGFSDRAPPMDG